jgi:riboflavin kinase/FMN adenylyltransferase
MLADEELSQTAPRKDAVLTIGVFDGVHLGHKHLIGEAKKAARSMDALAGVVTFRKHPAAVIDARTSLPYLTSLEEKLKLIKAEGVDFVVALTFDSEVAGLGAEEFVSLLVKHLRMRGLVIGPDFALGRGREGNAEALTSIGRKMGFFVTVSPPFMIDGEVVSSTAVRKALAEGDMARVARLTGRAYQMKGIIVSGEGLGRQLGFPTANLRVPEGWAVPRDGVYATLTHINGDTYRSMTSIGVRPTFGGKSRTIETYIVDYQGDLYGKDVSIDIVSWLREEKKFPDAESLKQQMAEDVARGKSILSSYSG